MPLKLTEMMAGRLPGANPLPVMTAGLGMEPTQFTPRPLTKALVIVWARPKAGVRTRAANSQRGKIRSGRFMIHDRSGWKHTGTLPVFFQEPCEPKTGLIRRNFNSGNYGPVR